MSELRSIEIRIGGRPPTPNNHTKNLGFVYAQARKWRSEAALAAEQQKPLDFGDPIALAEVQITFVVPDRRDRDWDNLHASTKPLTDGLVESGILAGDSTAVIRRVTIAEQYVKGQVATIYRITELPSEQLQAAL